MNSKTKQNKTRGLIRKDGTSDIEKVKHLTKSKPRNLWRKDWNK